MTPKPAGKGGMRLEVHALLHHSILPSTKPARKGGMRPLLALRESFGVDPSTKPTLQGRQKSSPPDGLGRWPQNAATSPEPFSILAFPTRSRVRDAGLRPPLAAPSALTMLPLLVGVCAGQSSVAGASTQNVIDTTTATG